MQDKNPYATPKAEVGGAETMGDENLKQIAIGQRMVILAVLLNFVTLALQAVSPLLALFAALVAFVLAIIGIFRLGGTVSNSVVVKILLVLMMIVPLLNLIVLLTLNSKATGVLRAGGYRVGLMGASKK